MRRENMLFCIIDEKREQAVIYNGWGERTSYIIMDEEREQAVIMDKEREQGIIIDKLHCKNGCVLVFIHTHLHLVLNTLFHTL